MLLFHPFLDLNQTHPFRPTLILFTINSSRLPLNNPLAHWIPKDEIFRLSFPLVSSCSSVGRERFVDVQDLQLLTLPLVAVVGCLLFFPSLSRCTYGTVDGAQFPTVVFRYFFQILFLLLHGLAGGAYASG